METAIASTEVEKSRAVAETQAAMLVAKRFPRDWREAERRIQNACSRPGLAEAALYQYARGGTDITGPSIRLAEAVAQSWGNMVFGIRELDQRNGVSTVEAFAWDMETNVRQVKEFQVPHRRKAHGKINVLEDPRDIYELVANQGARRLRACILGVIPGDVVEAAVTVCEKTLKAKADVTPERIKTMLDRFLEFGVGSEHIEARIQRHIEAMTPAQMVSLGKIYNSLKDGMSSAADWFDIKPPKAAGATLADRIREKASQTNGTGPFEPEPAAPVPPPQVEPCEWDNKADQAVIDQFKDLKTTGLSKWLVSQRGVLNDYSPTVIQYLQAKVKKVLGKTLGEALEELNGTLPPKSELVDCPMDEGSKMDPAHCNSSCEHRQGCPAFD